ncbi:MAG: hypothetical protein ACRDA1_12265, partial [Plesiomonas shigelloides]
MVEPDDAQVLRTEVLTLLRKGAIEMVPPSESGSGFYSRYFLVPKKDAGLRPILDLRLLNLSLMKRKFRMLTLKQILTQISPEDWFFSLNLKDAYFHIQIAPHHRRFLRFETHQTSQGRQAHSPPGGPTLEEPSLVLGGIHAFPESPMADPPEAGPPLSGEQDNLAPAARTLGSARMVPRWKPLSLPKDVLHTIAQARAPSTRRLYAQKWSVFVDWCSARNEDP